MQKLGRNGVVQRSWDGDDGGLDQLQEGTEVDKGPAAQTSRQILRLLRAQVGNADKLRLRKVGQNAGMLFAQVADTNHGDP